MVLMPSGAVTWATARIMGTGPTASTKSILRPAASRSLSFLVTRPLLAVAAVVGHDVGFAAGLAHFVLKDHHLCVARAFNEDDVIAGLLERLGRGQRHGRAHAAGENHAVP